MSEPGQSVRAFVEDAYQLISANTPTVPLQGNDLSKGIQFLNELMAAYAATGLMITVPQEIIYSLTAGQGKITIGPPDYSPTPDIISNNRLVNLENAWINLAGVDYPLIYESRHDFLATYKYQPLQGLPRFIIFYPDTNLTTIQVFPAPSQFYELHIYGKFQLNLFDSNADMSQLPTYYIRYLRFALAQDLALYKAREEAWSPKLQMALDRATADMVAATSVNMDIEVNTESWLNGSWRVRAGI